MPRNFELGKIYRIWSPDTEKVYIGSTTQQYLCRRLAQHNLKYRQWVEKKTRYLTSFEIVKFTTARIELLELYPCETIDELNSRESHYIRNMPNCINKCIPDRTREEYNELTTTCVCGAVVNRHHLAKHKKTFKHIKQTTCLIEDEAD